MGRTVKIVSVIAVSAVVLGSSITAAYIYFNKNVYNINESETEDDNTLEDLAIAEINNQRLNEAAREASVSGGLLPTAVFKYELYNETTKETDTVFGECPYELTGKSLADVKDFYPDWQVISFAPEEVLLRKNVGLSSENRYVVGIYEDYVAVFYENSEEGIYMMTDIPVNSLEDDKKNMLSEGIYVEGKERLNRILEDYSS